VTYPEPKGSGIRISRIHTSLKNPIWEVEFNLHPLLTTIYQQPVFKFRMEFENEYPVRPPLLFFGFSNCMLAPRNSV